MLKFNHYFVNRTKKPEGIVIYPDIMVSVNFRNIWLFKFYSPAIIHCLLFFKINTNTNTNRACQSQIAFTYLDDFYHYHDVAMMPG